MQMQMHFAVLLLGILYHNAMLQQMRDLPLNHQPPYAVA